MVKKLFLVLTVMAVALTSCESPMMENMTATPELAANKEKKPKKPKKLLVAQLDVEADGNSSETRLYDSNLNWGWEYGDALLGYQIAYDNIRNRFEYNRQTNMFSCPEFTYQEKNEARFHFVYPHGAEIEKGVLKAYQEGVWRPVCHFTTDATTVDALPYINFETLTSALELRIWSNENNAMQEQVVSAVLTADSDFVGRWTLDPETMTYTQDLNGKEIAIDGINTSVVQVNMPDMPHGYGDVEIKLVLTREDGRTCTTYLPKDLTYVKQKRTVYNLIFVPDPAFTCATYNVDGLPSLINNDGPGSKGTKTISDEIAKSGWDFVAFQEDFEYHTNLASSMGMYNFGKHRGSVGLQNIAVQADTDGLEFATLGATCSWRNETFVEFTKKHGGIFDGANTCIKKGFRYYLVTMKDGVQFDVYITHMNSGSSNDHIAARASQFQQLARYINEHRSGRPIIIMGDFNARYTRDDYATNFWNVLNADLRANLQDAWTELIWGGWYPEYGTPSWVVSDKYDPNNGVGDIKFGEQEGEVVDKILYINPPQANVRIWAKSYKRDMDYSDLADHNPVVVQFGYEKVK